MKNKLLILNYFFSTVIIICNVFIFIPITFNIFKDSFGPMGYGLLTLILLLSIHLFLVPNFIFLFSKRKSKKTFFIYNLLGLIYYLFIFIKFHDSIFYKH